MIDKKKRHFEWGSASTSPDLDPFAAEEEEAQGDEDLWFMPPPPEDVPPDQPPWGTFDGAEAQAQQRLRLWQDPRLWAAAEAALAPLLARAALAFGRLEERLAGTDQALEMAGFQVESAGSGARSGACYRLAVNEVAQLSWALGERLSPERLSLYQMGGLERLGDQAQVLLQGAWALRRLQQGAGLDPVADVAGFLGRAAGPEGARWQAVMTEARALHPFTRAAMGCQLWQIWGDGALEDRRQWEALVMAQRIAAEAGQAGLGQGALPFVPLALAGALRQGSLWQDSVQPSVLEGGSMQMGQMAQRVQARLAAWLNTVEAACQKGAMQLTQLGQWQQRARAGIADLSGRGPRQMIPVLAAVPLLSAPEAAARTGMSVLTARRILMALEARGLVRERSGRSRYRLWEAALIAG